MIHRLLQSSSLYSVLLTLASAGLLLELYAVMIAYSRELKCWRKELVKRMANSQRWKDYLESLSEWMTRRRGYTRVAGAFAMTACMGFIILGGIALPVEHVAIVNQTTTTKEPLYLPHVSEEMDQWHFWADPSRDVKRRTKLTFCKDGLEPPWNEGQTISWMTIRVEHDCLQLLGYEGKRDRQGNIIND